MKQTLEFSFRSRSDRAWQKRADSEVGKSKSERSRLVKRRRMISAVYLGDADYALPQEPPSPLPSRRTSITGWTDGMGRRLRAYVDNFREDFSGMVTLTYPEEFPGDGKTVKAHWRALVERLRRRGWLRDNSAVWFLEFQSRGAPHIHALITGWLEKGWVAKAWAEITGGDERACSRVEALKNPQSAAAYARKYAAKNEQKQVPEGFVNVGRMWGCVGPRHKDGEARIPRVAADVQGAPRQLVNDVEAVDGVRLYETERGWVAYGTEGAIMAAWRYLLDARQDAGRRARTCGSSQPSMQLG